MDDLRDVVRDRATPGAPGALNLVLLLESLGADSPFNDAVALSRGHLAVCRAAAMQLPSASGTTLLTASETLEDAIRQVENG